VGLYCFLCQKQMNRTKVPHAEDAQYANKKTAAE